MQAVKLKLMGRRIYRFTALFLLVIFITGFFSSSASALSSAQLQLFQSGIDYFDSNESNSGTTGCSDSTSCSCSSSGNGSPITLTGSDNGQKIWNFFSDQDGLTADQVAGIVGNLYAQDKVFNPEQIQIPPGGNSTTPTTQQGLGWGLAQWTPTGGGPNPIIAAAQSAGVSSADLDTLAGQLTIILWEMENTSPAGANDMINILEQQTSINAAADEFFKDFEGGGAGGPSGAEQNAVSMLQQYGGAGGAPVSGTTGSSGGCTTPNINCSANNQADSSLSPLRQSIVCLAQQQAALWSSEPLSYRNTGYYDYSNGVMELWCADFVSWIYNSAGDPFPDGVRDGWDVAYVGSIPSVYAGSVPPAGYTATPGFTYHPVGGSAYTPQPGDIGIFQTPSQYFGHTAIFISSSGGTTTWIGGDQDPTPNGQYGDSPDSESTVDSTTVEPTPLLGYVSPDGN